MSPLYQRYPPGPPNNTLLSSSHHPAGLPSRAPAGSLFPSVARALSEFYQIQEWEATLCCDNKRALEQSAYTRRRIRPSAKCADIQRSLKATKHTFKGKFTYLQVYDHMDKYLLWHQLSLIQQLNCVCDTLAKQVVTLAMTQGYHERPTQLLPKEDVAVESGGTKSPMTYLVLLGSTRARKWQDDIWVTGRRTHRQTSNLTRWTGSI
jgi:hypothetical protein